MPTIGPHTFQEAEHSTVSSQYTGTTDVIFYFFILFILGLIVPKGDRHTYYIYKQPLGSVKSLWDEAQYLTYSNAKLACKWRSVQETHNNRKIC